jgi:hypothetical protein
LITEEMKIKGLNHILYEITQLKLCANAIKDRFSRNARAVANKDEKYYCEKAAYTEALLIHTRTLKDFFEGQPKLPDKRDVNDLEKRADMFSIDYGFPPSDLGFDPLIKKRLDKDLAHLSYHRVSLPVDWNSNDTVDKLEPHIIKFLHHLHRNYRDVFDKSSAYYLNGWLDDEMEMYIEIVGRHLIAPIVNIVNTTATTYIPNNGFSKPTNKS